MKGLVYIVTDRGLIKWWLKVIGRRDGDLCKCRQVQSAAHLLQCPLVGDAKGRSVEECYKDKEWCKAVAEFVKL